jgi:hypothetical protein
MYLLSVKKTEGFKITDKQIERGIADYIEKNGLDLMISTLQIYLN